MSAGDRELQSIRTYESSYDEIDFDTLINQLSPKSKNVTIHLYGENDVITEKCERLGFTSDQIKSVNMM